MIAQISITIALGSLLGVISGTFAFLAMRVFPVIWVKTGMADWFERRTGFELPTAIMWMFGVVTRSWVGLYFGIVFMLFGKGILSPPIFLFLFRLLFLPTVVYDTEAHGYAVTIGIISAYAAYLLCAITYHNASRKALQSKG
jgi:hypothetical protein